MMEAEEVADRLHSAAIHVLRFVRREADRTDITPAQASALSVLVYGGPLTVGKLAEAEQVRSPTMTRVVDQMVRSGLAEKVPSPADGRSILVRATAAGAELMSAGRRRRVAALAERMEGLDSEALKTLRRASEILGQVINHPHHD